MRKIFIKILFTLFALFVILVSSAFLYEKKEILTFSSALKVGLYHEYNFCALPAGSLPIAEGFINFKNTTTIFPYSDSFLDTNLNYVIFSRKSSGLFYFYSFSNITFKENGNATCEHEFIYALFKTPN